MSILSVVRGTVRGAISPMGEAATYRIAATFNVRAGTLAASGATTISFSNVPAALTATAPGDTFSAGATTHTVTTAVTSAGGVLAGVTFTPALTVAVQAATQVVISRATDRAVTIIPEQIDGFGLQPGIYAGGDWRITVFGLPDGVEPSGAGGHKVVWGGRSVTVQPEIGRDPAGAGWIVRAK